MNNKQKNRKNKTSKVYSLLPEYQYVTGINSLQNGGQAFGYEDFMTNQLFKAQNGNETPGMGNPYAPECPEGQHWDATVGACVTKTVEVEGDKTIDNTSNDGTDKDIEKNPYNLPPWMTNTYSTAYNPYQGYNAGYPFQDEHSEAVNAMMDNSLLGAAFITANKLKGSGNRIKNAFKNINLKTGKPYQHTDFGVSTLTNTTDKNVLLNQEGLDNLYDDKGKIIDENNTAENLFINQSDAYANYFNQAADYHANTFVDDQGNSRMSKQHMDADGNITYADIEEEVDVINPNFNSELPEGPDNPMYIKEKQTRAHTDADLTTGDLAQDHIKDINVSRIQYNDDGSVKSMTRNTDEGKGVTVPYDKDADYTEGTDIEIINRQEEINRNREGSCASRQMCDDPNNPGECISCDEAQYGAELPKAQGGGLRKFVYAQNGANTDEMLVMQNEFNKANVGHYVEPIYNTTENVPYGSSSVGSKTVNTANTRSSNNDETSYEDDFVSNFNISNAAGADKIMADRTWLGNLFNKTNVTTADINKKRHLKNIEDKYGMSLDELLASGRWQLGPDGSVINTPNTSSSWSHSATRGNDMTFNETFGTFTEPNAANNWQGGFSTSITGDGNVEYYDEDVDKYWQNIGQYSTGDDNIYSDPANRGSFLPEVPIPGKYGGQLAYFQNGGTPQPSGRTYKIDGRVVTKEEYDNFIANGGTNATTDDDNIQAPVIPETTPQPPIIGPQPFNLLNYQNTSTTNNDADTDYIPDTIDIDAGTGTGEPVEGVEPYSPTPDAPVEFAYTDKPELTEEMMENMTDEQIEQYNKYRGREEKWNKLRADYTTSTFGKLEKGVSQGIKEGMAGVDFLNQVGTQAQTAVDEQWASNMNDEYNDFNTAIEASRSDKGDFDVNTGLYRANTLGYGDGPRGQIAQMGAETGSKPAPDYTYLKQFLDASIVSYDPSFLMTQARDGEEIDADMELIKQLMAAGADFEII